MQTRNVTTFATEDYPKSSESTYGESQCGRQIRWFGCQKGSSKFFDRMIQT
jgi:hypothetical protein